MHRPQFLFRRLVLVVVAGLSVASGGEAQQRLYKYKAIACVAPGGVVLRIETEVDLNADGSPKTDDVGHARMLHGQTFLEGTFAREDDVYNFRFQTGTLTIDPQGGAAYLYRQPNDPDKLRLVCRPVPVT